MENKGRPYLFSPVPSSRGKSNSMETCMRKGLHAAQTATTHSCLEPAEPHTGQAVRPFLQIETLKGIGLATSSQDLDPFPMAATERPFLGGEWPKGTCLTSPIWHHDIMSVAKVMPSAVSSSRGLRPASLQGSPQVQRASLGRLKEMGSCGVGGHRHWLILVSCHRS